jgi:uroporphyrinogen-III synthase
VGPATAQAVESRGARVSLLPAERHDGQAIVDTFAQLGSDEPRGRVLFPKSDRAAATVPQGLAALGHDVREVIAYRTVAAPGSHAIGEAIRAGRADAILFASPSAVEAFADAFEAGALPDNLPLFALGQRTESALSTSGFTVAGTAEGRRFEDLVAALVQFFERR